MAATLHLSNNDAALITNLLRHRISTLFGSPEWQGEEQIRIDILEGAACFALLDEIGRQREDRATAFVVCDVCGDTANAASEGTCGRELQDEGEPRLICNGIYRLQHP